MNVKGKFLDLLPGIVVTLIAALIAFRVYPDWGIAWDELFQREPGIQSWNYIFNGDKKLFQDAVVANHGAGFELLLVAVEKMLHLKDMHDIYLNRHIVTHLFFLLTSFTGYLLFLKLFKKSWIATLGLLMLLLSPRIYAHSYFNTKDMPFFCMITVILYCAQLAFENKKVIYWILLGAAIGFATSIRIMGVMYGMFVLGMAFIDFLSLGKDPQVRKQFFINIGSFVGVGVLVLYASWPFLWPAPIANFSKSFNEMANYTQWGGSVWFQGAYIKGEELPSSYFPTWFVISNPILWLSLGVGGLFWVLKDFFGNIKLFISNSLERNFSLAVACFAAPVVAVIAFHSIIYDDWRHLYFIYPAFVVLAMYVVAKLKDVRIQYAVGGAGVVQAGLVLVFMMNNHPFQQVYFNELVSKNDEYLRKNYELDYWGCGMKQELEYLLAHDKSPVIKISGNFQDILTNNITCLKPEDRARLKYVDPKDIDKEGAKYYLTNFRGHPEDYPSKDIVWEKKMLESTILRIYEIKPTVQPPQQAQAPAAQPAPTVKKP